MVLSHTSLSAILGFFIMKVTIFFSLSPSLLKGMINAVLHRLFQYFLDPQNQGIYKFLSYPLSSTLTFVKRAFSGRTYKVRLFKQYFIHIVLRPKFINNKRLIKLPLQCIRYKIDSDFINLISMITNG